MVEYNRRCCLLVASVIFLAHNVASFVPEENLVPYDNAVQFCFEKDTDAVLETSSSYKVFGSNYNKFFINGHGMVSLAKVQKHQFSKCKPSFPGGTVLAPYMLLNHQELDELDSHFISYQELIFKKTPEHFASIIADIRTAFPNYTNSPTKMIVVTWPNMSPIQSWYKYRKNTFQLIVASDNANTFVIFYYNQIQWPSDANMGITAVAGIFDEHNSSSYIIPESCSYAIRYIAGMTNIDQPGKFVFKVDSRLEFPSRARTCIPATKAPALVDVKPRLVPAVGTLPVILDGVTFCVEDTVTQITCTYWNNNHTSSIKRKGVEIPGHIAILCPTPAAFQSLGLYRLKIKIELSSNITTELESYVFVVMNSRRDTPIYSSGELRASLHRIRVINSDLGKVLSNSLGDTLDHFLNIKKQSVLVFRPFGWREIYTNFNVAVESSFKLSDKIMRNYFFNSSEANKRAVIRYELRLASGISLTRETAYDLDTSNIARDFKDCEKINRGGNYIQQQNHSCPVTVQQASRDFNFRAFEYSKKSTIIIFVEKFESDNTSLQVCIYNRSSQLIQVATKVSMTGVANLTTNPNLKYLVWEKFLRDYDEYLGCCNAGRLHCAATTTTPSNQLDIQTSYVFPRLFLVTWATQFTTPDGLSFLLDEVGVFWLLRSSRFAIRIFTKEIVTQTEHSAVVIKSVVIQASANLFRVNIVPEGLQVWMNQLPVNFYNSTGSTDFEYIYDSFTVHGDTYSVELRNTTSALFVFRHGISLKLFACVNSSSISIIGSIRNNFFEPLTGLLTLKSGDFSSSSKSYHWIVAEEDVLISGSDQVYATYNPTNGQSFKGCGILRVAGSNTSFYLNSSSCNPVYALTGNEVLANCSYNVSAEYEEIMKAARYRFPTAAAEITTSTTRMPAFVEETVETNPRTITEANQQEILNVFTKTDLPFTNGASESTQVPTTTQIMDEIVGSDITSENDAVHPQPTNEVSPFSHHKIPLILTGVFAGLAVLAFAGTAVLYIGMTRKAANFHPEALPNWTVEYKP